MASAHPPAARHRRAGGCASPGRCGGHCGLSGSGGRLPRRHGGGRACRRGVRIPRRACLADGVARGEDRAGVVGQELPTMPGPSKLTSKGNQNRIGTTRRPGLTVDGIRQAPSESRTRSPFGIRAGQRMRASGLAVTSCPTVSTSDLGQCSVLQPGEHFNSTTAAGGSRQNWSTAAPPPTVTTPDGTLWRYRYDPLGRRTAKLRLADDGETVCEEVLFTWDGTALCEQTTISPELPNPVALTWDHLGLRPLGPDRTHPHGRRAPGRDRRTFLRHRHRPRRNPQRTHRRIRRPRLAHPHHPLGPGNGMSGMSAWLQ